MPNITGSIYVAPRGWNNPASSGAFGNAGSGGGEGRVFGDYASYIYNFNATRSNSHYKDNLDECIVDNVAIRMCYYAF